VRYVRVAIGFHTAESSLGLAKGNHETTPTNEFARGTELQSNSWMASNKFVSGTKCRKAEILTLGGT
jgi:hypothetical protein